ncbi:hypothetical protein FRC08_002041, partial [Ceratobasidium sp. 394]
MSQQPTTGHYQTRAMSQAASRAAQQQPPPPETDPDVTHLNMPGTMPEAPLVQPIPLHTLPLFREPPPPVEGGMEVTEVPAEDSMVGPMETSVQEIENITRIMLDHTKQINTRPPTPGDAPRPGSGIRLVQPRPPNLIIMIMEAIKEGLITLQRAILSEIKRRAEPSIRTEGTIKTVRQTLQEAQDSAVGAQNNTYHLHT